MLDKVRKAAQKVHPQTVVEISPAGIVEVLLPEDCGLVWWATEGTMLVADAERFGGLAGALKETLNDIRIGTHKGKP